MQLTAPTFDMPDGGLNIRLVDDRIEQEARLIDYKRYAARMRIDPRRCRATQSGARVDSDGQVSLVEDLVQ